MLRNWWRRLFSAKLGPKAESLRRGRGRSGKPKRSRLELEQLEDRVMLSSIPGGVTIEGIPYNENAANNGGAASIPPDPHGAAGANHVVSVVNTSIEWHTKAGVRQNGQSLAGFFAPLTPVNSLFDPKVIYDQWAGRFVVVALEQQDTANGAPVNSSRILVAASQTSDPNAGWFFLMQAPAPPLLPQLGINSMLNIGGVNRWADYPGLAVDRQAIYITANMFSFGAPPRAFADSRLWIIGKGLGTGGFYSGGFARVSVHDPSGPGLNVGTLIPAHTYGQPANGVGTWLVSYNGLSLDTAADGRRSESIRVFQVDGPLGAAPAFPIFTQLDVNLGNIENARAAFPNAPQSGGAAAIDTGDRRALDAVWRDNSLYATMTIVPSSGTDAGQATAHWVRINTAGSAIGSPSLALADQGDVGGEDIAPGTHTFFPSIAVDQNNNMAIGFAASGPGIFAGAYYTGRLASDPAGTVRASRQVAPGLDSYVNLDLTRPPGRQNRWGDYTAVSIDPADDTTFWAFNEHALPAAAGGQGRWGTRWASFGLPEVNGSLVISADDNPGRVNRANDGTADEFRLVRNGDNLETYINGRLFLALPLTRVTDIMVNGSADDDTIRIVGPLGINTITVDGRGGNNNLELDYSGSGAATYVVRPRTVTRGVGTITYDRFQKLELKAGNDSDRIDVRGTAAATATTVNAGGGDDRLNIFTDALRLDGIHVTINGEGGRDTLVVTNQGWAGSETFKLTDKTIEIASHGLIATYGTIENLDLTASGGNDIINVVSTAAATATTVRGSNGDDDFYVGSVRAGEDGSLERILGPLSVLGNQGTDRLFLNNQLGRRAQYKLTASTLSVVGVAPITYRFFEELTLNAGASVNAAGNTLHIESTDAATTTMVNAGSGDDDIFVANANNRLDGIHFNLDGQGGNDALNIFNTGWAGAETHTITPASYSIASHGEIVAHGSVERIELRCGSGPDTIIFSDWRGTALLDGGAGFDTVRVSRGTLSTSRVELVAIELLDVNGGNALIDADASVGAATATAGNVELRAATLTAPGGVQLLAGGGVLTGAGTINGAVSNSGHVTPGGSGTVGVITLNGNYTQTATGNLRIDLNGNQPGVSYDQLRVNGTVGLAGMVNVVAGVALNPNNTFAIIDNDLVDAVAGTFNGLPEGAILNVNGQRFNISYLGGTGNDVVLTRLHGALALVLDDPATPHVDVIIADNRPAGFVTSRGPTTHADLSALEGEIVYSAAVGGFSVVVVTALSKPLLANQLLLDVVTVSGSPGTLVAIATDTDFQGVAGTNTVQSPIGGVTAGTVTFVETVDPANHPFAGAELPTTVRQGPFSGGAFSGTKQISWQSPGPSLFSLTKTLVIQHGQAGLITSVSAMGVFGEDSSRSYEARVANLRGTGSGTDFQNRRNADFFLRAKGPGATVFDDGARDVLTGAAGRDWFFANWDAGVLDRITDLHDREFIDDLDFILR